MENSSNPPTPYRFTNDELRALQECNSESFFYRSLPLSAVMGVGAHVGVKTGYFNGTRFGSAPKVALAVVAGYILGKISYQGKCAEKIMALPDSKLGAVLRERKRAGKYTESMTLDQADMGQIFKDSTPRDVYSEDSQLRPHESAPSYMDIDTERHNQDIDTYNWTKLDDPRIGEESMLPPPSSRTVTSYDELRRRNREEYETARNKYSRPAAKPEELPQPSDPQPMPPRGSYPRSDTTNQYGDLWEK